MEYEQVTPSVSQARRIKKLSLQGQLTANAVLEIMMEQKKPVRNDVTLAGEIIQKYFPKSYTPSSSGNCHSETAGNMAKETRT